MTILKIQELDTLEELSDVEAKSFDGQLGLGFGLSGLPLGLSFPPVAGNLLGGLPGGLTSVAGNLLGGLLGGLPLP